MLWTLSCSCLSSTLNMTFPSESCLNDLESRWLPSPTSVLISLHTNPPPHSLSRCELRAAWVSEMCLCEREVSALKRGSKQGSIAIGGRFRRRRWNVYPRTFCFFLSHAIIFLPSTTHVAVSRSSSRLLHLLPSKESCIRGSASDKSRTASWAVMGFVRSWKEWWLRFLKRVFRSIRKLSSF